MAILSPAKPTSCLQKRLSEADVLVAQSVQVLAENGGVIKHVYY